MKKAAGGLKPPAAFTARGAGLRPIRRSGRVLSLGLTAAVRDGRLIRNVAEGVPLPRVVATPKRFLTHDQVQALAEACPPYETLIRVLAYAGLRHFSRYPVFKSCAGLAL